MLEIEAQDGKIVDKHSGDYVPSIVENASVWKLVTADNLTLLSLETVDPFISGVSWLNNGVVTVSAGV